MQEMKIKTNLEKMKNETTSYNNIKDVWNQRNEIHE